ncbi:hypothetical protein EB093_10060 [bacterium]|nr:hypothetical protein [bacterium]
MGCDFRKSEHSLGYHPGESGFTWNWDGISQNPNITWDIIQANLDKPLDWYGISRNPMTRAKQEFIREKKLAYYKPVVKNILDKYDAPTI